MNGLYFWTGSYARPDQNGISRCRFDPETGFTVPGAYPGLTNPSYVLEHPALPVLYAVEETEEGAVCALGTEGDRPELLGRIGTGGASPCHLSLSPDGRWLYCANYMGGSVAVIRLDGAGIPAERTCLVRHEGKGPNPLRQEMAHAHCAVPWRGLIGVCDLGEDRVYLYENKEETLRETAVLHAPPGSGPRHLAPDPARPDLLWCAAELSGEVFCWQQTGPGAFVLRQRIRTLPASFTGENTAAAIRFTEDGKWLLVSHRGADGIAALPVDEDGNAGEPVWSPCVRGPRDFLLRGDTVLAGSQRDGEIRAYTLEAGRLRDTGFRMEIQEPVCLQQALR